jgi:hypothetical protein
MPWDNEIIDLLKPFTSVNWKKNDRWENRVKKRIDKIHHKLDAIKYHIESFKNFEWNVETNYKKRTTANTTMNKTYDDPLLIYNFESFVFKKKCCIDLFYQFLANCLKKVINTNNKIGDDIVKMFQKKKQNESSKEV